ncbi:MAG: PH domain-containing protein [Acidimicrobiia bacterium]
MPFPRKLLNPDEEIKVDLHPHWWFFSQPATAVVITFVITVFGLVKDNKFNLGSIGAVLLLASAIWFGARYWNWATTNFVITSDRLIFRHGVFAKSGIEIPLERVNNVNFRQSLFERILGAGDLLIESGGEDGQQRFTDIRKPEMIQNAIHREIASAKDRIYQPRTSFAPPPPPPGAPISGAMSGAPSGATDPIEQLRRLEELRKQGVLTQAEFDAQKAKLLDKM